MTVTTTRSWGTEGWYPDAELHRQAHLAARLRAYEGTLQQVGRQLDAVTHSQRELISSWMI